MITTHLLGEERVQRMERAGGLALKDAGTLMATYLQALGGGGVYAIVCRPASIEDDKEGCVCFAVRRWARRRGH